MVPARLPVLLVLACLMPVTAQAQVERDDRFLTGYVTALLEGFGLEAPQVQVEGGVLLLDPTSLPAERRDEIIDRLTGVAGLRLQLSEAAPPVAPPGAGPPPPVAEVPAAPPQPAPGGFRVTGFLPSEYIFDELLADPRWPRFSASLQFYEDDRDLDVVGSANFGGTLPLFGWRDLGATWQVALQAGVFSIFDMQAESKDLVNADYFVGLPVSVSYGAFAAQARVFHQSSHLGDEFILRREPERINLSYEGLDLLLSYELFDLVRLYGGGGALVHTDPEDLEEWRVQGGIEVTSPTPILGNQLYPLAALDVQATEEGGWNPDYSVRAGLELRNELLEGRRLQFMFEYFDGSSPNGQFFDSEIEYLGGGVQFYF